MDISVITDNFSLLLKSIGLTVLLTVAVIVISTVLAVPLAILRQTPGVLSSVIAGFSWTMRAIPSLVLLFFVFYGLPQLGYLVPALTVAIIGLSMQAVGYAMEVVRGGLMSIDPRQHDAVKALGVPAWEGWRRVLLPQALTAAIPPYFSNTIHILQGTTLASVITVQELTGTANNLIGLTYRAVPLLLFSAVVYLILASVLTLLQEVAERHWRIPGARTKVARIDGEPSRPGSGADVLDAQGAGR